MVINAQQLPSLKSSNTDREWYSKTIYSHISPMFISSLDETTRFEVEKLNRQLRPHLYENPILPSDNSDIRPVINHQLLYLINPDIGFQEISKATTNYINLLNIRDKELKQKKKKKSSKRALVSVSSDSSSITNIVKGYGALKNPQRCFIFNMDEQISPYIHEGTYQQDDISHLPAAVINNTYSSEEDFNDYGLQDFDEDESTGSSSVEAADTVASHLPTAYLPKREKILNIFRYIACKDIIEPLEAKRMKIDGKDVNIFCNVAHDETFEEKMVWHNNQAVVYRKILKK